MNIEHLETFILCLLTVQYVSNEWYWYFFLILICLPSLNFPSYQWTLFQALGLNQHRFGPPISICHPRADWWIVVQRGWGPWRLKSMHRQTGQCLSVVTYQGYTCFFVPACSGRIMSANAHPLPNNAAQGGIWGPTTCSWINLLWTLFWSPPF